MYADREDRKVRGKGIWSRGQAPGKRKEKMKLLGGFQLT